VAAYGVTSTYSCLFALSPFVFLLIKSIGTIQISLKTKVPIIRNKNPRSSHGRKSSQPSESEIAHIANVLHVSTVDL